ncbi:hypothetical protein Bhyg_16617 [Pseudolycoriella hygida]|uniref:Uncharacterized protein n=1 Tax=Pseudolycoriella hygida TaxID=35572 RepID=A0A9Q0MKT0_9DIPT|nr:hypothetical protein Bhyg_16617 [Pseudolycoriella hygida]
MNMVLFTSICQNLNKKLSDLELAHEFRQHGLYLEYLKSNEETEQPSTSLTAWGSCQPVLSITSMYERMKLQDSVFFQKWWQMNRNRKHSPRKTDVILMLEAIKSNDFLMQKLKSIFAEYDHFMKMYRKLETLIQKQLFLTVCLHTVIVVFAIHLFLEVLLDWGDLMSETNIRVIKVNFAIHLIQIFHDFGCMALAAIMCRNEENVYAFNLFKMDGCSYFMVVLQYVIVGWIYALYQYFDIKLYNLQSTVDLMNADDE